MASSSSGQPIILFVLNSCQLLLISDFPFLLDQNTHQTHHRLHSYPHLRHDPGRHQINQRIHFAVYPANILTFEFLALHKTP